MEDELHIVLEHLATALTSGTTVTTALEQVRDKVRSKQLKKIIDSVRAEIIGGSNLSTAVEHARMVPQHLIPFIRTGEETGRLSEILNSIAFLRRNDHIARSKITRSLIVPLVVFSLTIITAFIISLFSIPYLVRVSEEFKLALPSSTIFLITILDYFGRHLWISIPTVIVVLSLPAGTLVSKKIRALYKGFLLNLSVSKRFIQERELARFGTVLATLLEDGLLLPDILDLLHHETPFADYKDLYGYLSTQTRAGDSLQKSLEAHPETTRLIPETIQQLIVAGEESGYLSDSLMNIGTLYENKTDQEVTRLAHILVPILIVTACTALAVLTAAVTIPMYHLINGLDKSPAGYTKPQQTLKTNSKPLTTKAVKPAVQKPSIVRLVKSESGFVNVRSEPSLTGAVLKRIKSEGEFTFTEARDGWYNIVFEEGSVESGWIFGQYAEEVIHLPNQ